MGYHKKIQEFALSFDSSYGFPIEEHMDYWIKKYEQTIDKQRFSTNNNGSPTRNSESQRSEDYRLEGDS